MYVNEKWCKNITVVEKNCDKNIEMLVVSLRPFYLPREINSIYTAVVYILPDSNYNEASDKLYGVMCSIENKSPDAVKIILTGDFNSCDFQKHVPHYQQCVNCSNREEKTLDLFFCNIKNSYVVHKKCPLGTSDHNMLHVLPVYIARN